MQNSIRQNRIVLFINQWIWLVEKVVENNNKDFNLGQNGEKGWNLVKITSKKGQKKSENVFISIKNAIE